MAGIHIRKGDTVEVISGGDKGQKGKVLAVLVNDKKVLVERVKIVKKHQRPSQQNPAGGIMDKEAAIDASNVRLVCPKCSEKVRARRTKLEDGKWMRKCPSCNEVYE